MLFNGLDEKWARQMSFAIGWQQHGGSGLSFGRDDINHMTIDDLTFYANEAYKQRKREADAVKAAYKSKK